MCMYMHMFVHVPLRRDASCLSCVPCHTSLGPVDDDAKVQTGQIARL